MVQFFFFLQQKPAYYWPLWSPVIGRDTFSALEPVLGPSRKKLAVWPSSTVHGGQHDTPEYQISGIRVATAWCIRGWRNLGFYAWTSLRQKSKWNKTRFSGLYDLGKTPNFLTGKTARNPGHPGEMASIYPRVTQYTFQPLSLPMWRCDYRRFLGLR